MPRPKPIAFRISDRRPIFAFNSDWVAICGSPRTKREGICDQDEEKLYPNGRCYYHGGPSTGHGMIHGRRSKLYKTLKLGERADHVLSDEDILSHQENIELYEAMMVSEAEKPLAGAGDLNKALSLFRKVLTAAGDEKRERALDDLGKCLEAMASVEARRARVLGLADRQRSHKEAQGRLEALAENSLSMRQLTALTARFAHIVETRVSSPHEIRLIGQDLVECLPEGSRPALDAEWRDADSEE